MNVPFKVNLKNQGQFLDFKNRGGRAVLCPPQTRGNGAHGVTRPTETRTFPNQVAHVPGNGTMSFGICNA
jgi:hypothetical protein